MYPGDPGNPGGDCAGIVISSNASHGSASHPIGQRVFGLAVGSLGTAVTCAADTMVPVPACLTAEEAASMPTVFITARAALRQVAATRPSERVLLQATAGGVGLAGLQVAAALGCTPLGTAGSPAKRGLLRSLGVVAVAGSRDTCFASDLALATHGAGADVVLNSLTSPGMVGGALALLRRGGRLVEIGKRDVWSGAAVAAQRPDVAYSLLAVDFLPDGEVQSALRAVAAGAAAGALRPLPLVGHGLSGVAAALRAMSQVRGWHWRWLAVAVVKGSCFQYDSSHVQPSNQHDRSSSLH